MDSYIQDRFAERIGGSKFGKDTPIYKFEKIKRAKKEALKFNPNIELIDMGVGEPDEMAFSNVVNSLKLEAEKSENRGYADNGIEQFKEAAASYMQEMFGVNGIDPVTEVNHSIGSKSALSLLPLAFVNRGDCVAQTIPGYPVMATHTKYLGGEVFNLELKEENKFLPDLDSIPTDLRKKIKLLYVNYPNNPTGAGATLDFFKDLVKFATENDIIVVHDAAYAGLTYAEKPLSFLSVEGAKEVGVELHSLSKSHNMTGWRIGFVAGNELVVKAFATVKDNSDSGQFIPIQKAAITALSDLKIPAKITAKYKRRMNMLVDALKSAGFNPTFPAGSFFLYTKMPKGLRNDKMFSNAEDFSQWLIKEKLISTVPWDDVGHYIRFSVTFAATDLNSEAKVIDEVKRRLIDAKLVF